MIKFNDSMDEFDPLIFKNQSIEEKKIELDIQNIDFKNLPVERYLQDLYINQRDKKGTSCQHPWSTHNPRQ